MTGRSRFSTTRRPRPTPCTATRLPTLAARTPTSPRPRLHRAPGTGDLAGHFHREHLLAATAMPRAETFVCGPAPLIDAAARCAAAEAPERLHVEAFTLPLASIRSGEAEGTVSFGASRLLPTTGAPCWSRPRPPGCAPSSAAGWASATAVPAARPRAPSATSSPARRPPGRGGDPHLRLGPGRRRRAGPLRAQAYFHDLPPPIVEPPQQTPNSRPHTAPLTAEQIEAFGAELDAIRDRHVADLGERDVTYIRRVIKAQRGLEIGGRALLSRRPSSRRHGSPASAPSRCRRSSTTWRSATTSCTASTTGPAFRRSRARASSGTPPARATSGATPTTTCTTPTRTSSARTATSATASCGCPRTSRGAPTTWGTRSTRRRWCCSSSTGCAARHGDRADRRGRDDVRREVGDRSADLRRRSGGRRCKDYVLFPLLSGPVGPTGPGRQRDRQPQPQRVGVHRSSSAGTSPRDARVHDEETDGELAGTGTSASCSARPT